MNVNQVLAKQLATVLLEKGARVTTAESCTGGWIAKTLTDLPGSSAWFEYGFVSYGNHAKQQLLGVDSQLLEDEGAVSEAVVVAMARGALAASGSDYAIAVSGIAGPDGGTAAKPVGTVWIGWVGPAGAESQCFLFEGDRDRVRRQSVSAALQGLVQRIQGGSV
jgi:nicotinamide-nucleotide amidase